MSAGGRQTEDSFLEMEYWRASVVFILIIQMYIRTDLRLITRGSGGVD